MVLSGQCLCGQIQYSVAIDDAPTLVFCHCARCRKATGSAFNSALVVAATQFHVQQGKNRLKQFSFNGVNRHFCADCGSPLYSSRDSDATSYRLRVGTLDTPINPAKKVHIFTGSKANWDVICDDNPQFEGAMTQ